jgi:hypothetical protein
MAGTPSSPGGVAPMVAPPPGDTATLMVDPSSGPPTTVVTISNNDSCFGGSATATVTLHDPAVQTASQSNVDGGWSVQITVAANTPRGNYDITATCSGADEDPADYDYTPSSFTVFIEPTPPPHSPSPTPSPSPSPKASPAAAVEGNANFTG